MKARKLLEQRHEQSIYASVISWSTAVLHGAAAFGTGAATPHRGDRHEVHSNLQWCDAGDLRILDPTTKPRKSINEPKPNHSIQYPTEDTPRDNAENGHGHTAKPLPRAKT